MGTAGGRLVHLPPKPRVVCSGNFATPHALLRVGGEQVSEYTLHMLNAQSGIPDREGVTYETCFVGPAMRSSPRLRYIPSQLSLVSVLYRGLRWPDAVMVHASAFRYDTVSLGIEVNVMPAAIEAARALGAPVIVRVGTRTIKLTGPLRKAIGQVTWRLPGFPAPFEWSLSQGKATGMLPFPGEYSVKVTAYTSATSTRILTGVIRIGP